MDVAWKKKAALFLASQSVSIFGSTIVSYVIIWYITLQTSSGKWMTLAILCSMLPQTLISLWAGVLADRFNRKKIAMYADAFIALATLAPAIAFALGRGSIGILLAASVCRSIGSGLQSPAVSAIYPQIVPRQYLTKVNGIYHTIASCSTLISPAIAALMLDRIGISWAFFLDVATASIAIAILFAIDIPSPPEPEERKSALGNLRTGLALTFGNRLLKQLVICYAVFFFLHSPVSFLSPIMIARSFGGEAWRLSLNEIVWSVGSLLGGVAVSLKGEIRHKARTVGLCVMAFGVCFALLGLAGNFPLFLLVMGIAGFFLPLHTTAQTVLIQESVDESAMGRVFSVIQLIPGAMMPAGMLLFGPMGDAVQIEHILIAAGSMQVVLGLLFLRATGGLKRSR